jgi:hypothetical protein
LDIDREPIGFAIEMMRIDGRFIGIISCGGEFSESEMNLMKTKNK